MSADELRNWLANRVVDVIEPKWPDWRRVDLRELPDGPRAVVYLPDASAFEFDLPGPLGQALRELREVSAGPRALNTRVMLDAPGRVFSSFYLKPAAEPRPSRLNPLEQTEVLREITNELLHRLPGDWSQVWLQFRCLGSFVETSASMLSIHGGASPLEFPEVVLPLFLELRAGMFREHYGSWRELRFRLTQPPQFHAEYEWREEPRWLHRPSAGYAVEELEQYPIDAAETPAWLREMAG